MDLSELLQGKGWAASRRPASDAFRVPVLSDEEVLAWVSKDCMSDADRI